MIGLKVITFIMKSKLVFERATLDNIFILHSLISRCINNNNKLYSAFIDLKKAFDYVVRGVLWYRLIQTGIRSKILNVIQSMYRNIKAKVKFNNTLSDEFSSYFGVRLGECVSPFFFIYYVYQWFRM